MSEILKYLIYFVLFKDILNAYNALKTVLEKLTQLRLLYTVFRDTNEKFSLKLWQRIHIKKKPKNLFNTGFL